MIILKDAHGGCYVKYIVVISQGIENKTRLELQRRCKLSTVNV